MTWKNCIQDGVSEGVISQGQADEMKDLFDSRLAENEKSMSPGDAIGQSAKEVTDSVK